MPCDEVAAPPRLTDLIKYCSNQHLYKTFLLVVSQSLLSIEAVNEFMKRWDEIVEVSAQSSFSIYDTLIRQYVIHSRSEFLQIIELTFPIVLSGGGNEAGQETVQAIIDAGTWWP